MPHDGKRIAATVAGAKAMGISASDEALYARAMWLRADALKPPGQVNPEPVKRWRATIAEIEAARRAHGVTDRDLEIVERSLRQRARRTGAARPVPTFDRPLARLAEAQNWRCVYCAVQMTMPVAGWKNHDAATRDHVLALARGGTDDDENIVIACDCCNFIKGDAPVDVFLASAALRRRQRKVAARNHEHRYRPGGSRP